MEASEGSPDLKIGVMIGLFQLSGTVLFLSERLNKALKAGAIEVAVPRNMHDARDSVRPGGCIDIVCRQQFEDHIMTAGDIYRTLAKESPLRNVGPPTTLGSISC